MWSLSYVYITLSACTLLLVRVDSQFSPTPAELNGLGANRDTPKHELTHITNLVI